VRVFFNWSDSWFFLACDDLSGHLVLYRFCLCSPLRAFFYTKLGHHFLHHGRLVYSLGFFLLCCSAWINCFFCSFLFSQLRCLFFCFAVFSRPYAPQVCFYPFFWFFVQRFCFSHGSHVDFFALAAFCTRLFLVLCILMLFL